MRLVGVQLHTLFLDLLAILRVLVIAVARTAGAVLGPKRGERRGAPREVLLWCVPADGIEIPLCVAPCQAIFRCPPL